MTEAIILTHYFVRSKEENKLPMIEFSIEHCRKNNPNSYIIGSKHNSEFITSYKKELTLNFPITADNILILF